MDLQTLTDLENLKKEFFKHITQNIEMVLYLVAEFGSPFMILGWRSPKTPPEDPRFETDWKIIQKKGPNVISLRWRFFNLEVQILPGYDSCETNIVGLHGDTRAKDRANAIIEWLSKHRMSLMKGGKHD